MGLIVKLFVCPLTVIASDLLFPNVNYSNIYQPIIVGLVLAVMAHIMDVLLLKRGTFWMSNISDFIAATLIVYVVSLFFSGAVVTFFGAILTGLLLAFTEYVQHLWLLRSGKTKKSPA